VTDNQYVNSSPQVSQTNVDRMNNDASDLGRMGYTASVGAVELFIPMNSNDIVFVKLKRGKGEN
jgi:hypothetical protein